MNLLELASELGLQPKRTAGTSGGEFHSPCPACGGRDRFALWPVRGRYWCRQCSVKGDVIQFCRDFLGLSFQEALQRVGQQRRVQPHYRHQASSTYPLPSSEPPAPWRTRATEFVLTSHQQLLKYDRGLDYAKSRGLTMETLRRYRVGWSGQCRWEPATEWGLASQGKTVWIPTGLVIPSFQERQQPQKIKIRRLDGGPKYILVSGSRNQFAVYGDTRLPIVLVEAELDAILLQQEAGGLCCGVALGGVANRPDRELHLLLRSRPILWSLDNDQAATAQFDWWSSRYPHLKPWRAPRGKSPSEACAHGVQLDDWIQYGLSKR